MFICIRTTWRHTDREHPIKDNRETTDILLDLEELFCLRKVLPGEKRDEESGSNETGGTQRKVTEVYFPQKKYKGQKRREKENLTGIRKSLFVEK